MSPSSVVWHPHEVTTSQRSAIKPHQPGLIWLTGLSGAGKSTIANALERELLQRGCHTWLMDGDNFRQQMGQDLGFSAADRAENLRRAGVVASMMVDAGLLVISAFISPQAIHRQLLRQQLGGRFIEVFVDTPLMVCEQRDPKGLYQRARAGQITDFTGISSSYERPDQPELHLPGQNAVHDSVQQIIRYLQQQQYLTTSSRQASFVTTG
jgi:adenylylsulfate kinase